MRWVIIQTGSFQFEDRIEERSTASFVVNDISGTGNYVQGERVQIFDGEISIPAGHTNILRFIDDPQSKRIGLTAGRIHIITCKDNNYLADKRLVVSSYANKHWRIL